MFFQNKQIDNLVEICELGSSDRSSKNDCTCSKSGREEEQDPEESEKQNLVFSSGESLPGCWVDENYRNT
jgi:hypothetical protein